MARTKRIVGASGIYHILLRGNDRLFTADADYRAFLNTLREYFDGYQSFLLGYVLLSNRVHLIVEIKNNNPAAVIKPICTSYARYFNRMHQKTGRLFYDRYKSIPLETGEQLADTLAFVHAVPSRAGLENWMYSSRSEYADEADLCSTERAEQFAGGPQKLLSGDNRYIGLEDYVHMSAEEIENYMRALCGYGFSEFRNLSQDEQKAVLKLIKAQKWIRVPRLSALLGMELQPEKKAPEPKEEPQKEELSIWLL